MDKDRYMKVQTVFSIDNALLEISNLLEMEIGSGMHKFHEIIDKGKDLPHLHKLQKLKNDVHAIRNLYQNVIAHEASVECKFNTSLIKNIINLSQQIRQFESIVSQDLISRSNAHRWRSEYDVAELTDPENIRIPLSLYIQLNFNADFPPRFMRIPSVIVHQQNHRVDINNPICFLPWTNQSPWRQLNDNINNPLNLCATLKTAYEMTLINFDEMLHIESICYDSKVFQQPYLFVINAHQEK